MTVLKVNQIAELRKQVDAHGGDFLRNLVQEAVQQLMSAEVDGLCGAAHGFRSPDRVNQRNIGQKIAGGTPGLSLTSLMFGDSGCV